MLLPQTHKSLQSVRSQSPRKGWAELAPRVEERVSATENHQTWPLGADGIPGVLRALIRDLFDSFGHLRQEEITLFGLRASRGKFLPLYSLRVGVCFSHHGVSPAAQ